MSSSSEDCDINATPPDIVNAAKIINENLLPEKSKERYLTAYNNFITWKNEKKTSSFSENVLLAYFGELACKYKPPSLWATYSMLKSTIKTRDCINIGEYSKLTAYLKRQSDGYVCKKSKVLTGENVEKFINEAPDDKYLATKVALILGITGACRRQELSEITTNDLENHGEMLLVKIPNTKNKIPRSFIVHGKYRKIVKKYENLRSTKGNNNRFFQQFRNGKCTVQVIGKNKFGNMPREIAEYLNLPDAKFYTGHTFRRTSATLLADSGADIMTLKRHGGWRSNNVAEGYIEDSLNSKQQIGVQISNSIFKSCDPTTSFVSNMTPKPSTSFAIVQPEQCASTSTANMDPEPRRSSLSQNVIFPTDEERSAKITNNLSQTITLPEKNMALNFNSCNVTINFNK